MKDYRLGEIEARFAQLIWQHEPVGSGELVKLAQAELNWKKSTTYTVLRRLCERGLFRNEDGAVTSVLSQEQYRAGLSEQLVQENFRGSLPAFIAAFANGRRLTEDEIRELEQLIAQHRENGNA